MMNNTIKQMVETFYQTHSTFLQSNYPGLKPSRLLEEYLFYSKKNVDEILCLGDEWKHIKNLKVFLDHESLAKHLKSIVQVGDVVLIKGSRFMKMEKVFDFINC